MNIQVRIAVVLTVGLLYIYIIIPSGHKSVESSTYNWVDNARETSISNSNAKLDDFQFV